MVIAFEMGFCSFKFTGEYFYQVGGYTWLLCNYQGFIGHKKYVWSCFGCMQLFLRGLSGLQCS